MKFNKNTYLLLVLFTLLIALLMGLEEFFEGELSGEGVIEEMAAYLAILVILLVTTATPIYKVIKKLNHNLLWKNHFLKRFSYEFAIVLLMSSLLSLVFGNLIHHFIEHNLATNTVLTRTFLFLFLISSLLFGIFELMLLSEQKDELKRLNEQLAKENISSLYNALKNQVNPHFLFNNLSILSALIHYDTEKSEQFIHAFSDTYRYVLELKDENLVPLERELAFLDNYYFLQKIRFGNNLIFAQNIPIEAIQYHIPPLALQLLFENAIKHNIVSKKQPLHIHLYLENKQLIFKNNYQKRTDSPVSTGIGLKNLTERYLLINTTSPTFVIENGEYKAKLPLIYDD